MKYLNILLIATIPYIFYSFLITSTPKIVPPADNLEWFTDFNNANAKSQETGKPIFAFFTGSDWCGWCRKLQADVFAKGPFVEWANKNVVLLELDFPRRKEISDTLRQQNTQLAQLFQVKGYPTIWIFDAVLNEETNQIQLQAYGSLGYPSGAEVGKEEVKFLETANDILAKKP